ncbi:hypothetical protein Slin14017_G054260 [Septoria linicola]|nr:hypothetical protein Slin14017_G054260 [Septoria linicola]
MLYSTALLPFAYVISGAVTAIDAREPYSPRVCSVINHIVRAAKAQDAAASYCSSYLKIPAYRTTTISSTSTTIVSTITSINTIRQPTVDETSTVTVTAPTMILSFPPACISGSLVERGVKSVPKPACLLAYRKPAAISSACSCLCTKRRAVVTTTVVTTTSVTATVTSTEEESPAVIPTVTSTTTRAVTEFYIQASGGAIDGRYANPRPTNGQVLFDSNTPETAYRLRDDCSFEVVGGEFSGAGSTYRDGTFSNNVYAGNGQPLICRVVLGNSHPQLTCPINGDGTNSASPFGRGEWEIEANPNLGEPEFTANLLPVVT